MTRRLILMRHAKSDWKDQSLSDHARPLNGRGRRAANLLGQWLREKSLIPDQILCSSARRTMETCERLKLPVAPESLESLYLADVTGLFDVLRQATGRCVLLLGHNPGLAEFSQTLLTTPPAHDRFCDYPTGATLVARFEIARWREVKPGSGTAEDFVIPKDLT